MPRSSEVQGKSVQTALADSDNAVFDLLEALLQEVDDLPAEPRSETVVPVAQTLQTAPLPVPGTELVPEPEPIPVPVPVPGQELVAPAVTEVALSTLAQDNDPERDGSLPAWTREPQQCLLFEVEDTLLAIPLIMLDSIAVWDAQAVSMPTQPDWHLGVLPIRGDNHVIVDTARLIMPEKLVQSAEQRRVEHGSHLLIVQQRWALSCDGIHETILLTPDQVKWRPRRPSRPWALGTLIERLCVLLDTDQLIQEIEQE